MNARRSITRQISQLLAGRKSKITIYVIGVLWIAVIMQIAVNTMLKPQSNILEAFVSTNSEVSSFELEMAANYGNAYLSEADKKDMILYLANRIGLDAADDVTVTGKGGESEVYAEKKGKNAETLIKIVSIRKENTDGLSELNHYLMINLKLYKNIDSILNYRDLIKDAFHNLKAANIQTTMQLCSNYQGKLSLNSMNKIADGMIDNLEGKVAYENRKENLFTVYAYSGLLDEYVTSLGTKINIHVAINYDENEDSTNVYLGTPVINGGY